MLLITIDNGLPWRYLFTWLIIAKIRVEGCVLMIKLSSRSSSCLFLIKICCFFAFFQSTLVSLSSADEVLKQKFLREYITESEFIEAKLSKVRGKFHVERAEKKQEADFQTRLPVNHLKICFIVGLLHIKIFIKK